MLAPRQLTVSLLLTASLFSLAACDTGPSDEEVLADIAGDVCIELENGRVFEIGGILASGRREALEELGSSAGYTDALRAECPGLMAAVDAIEEEEERREGLPDAMRVRTTSCSSEEARGTVENTASVTVDVFVEVQFLDDDGVVIDDGLDSVRGLRAGETGNWTAGFFGEASRLARCRASVSSVFEQ